MESMLFGNLNWQILEKQHKKFPICKLKLKNNKYQDKEESRKNEIKISYVSVRYLLKSIRDRSQCKSIYI